MSEKEKYIPNKGDIVWIDFGLSSDQQTHKHHPGLVVSRYDFKRRTRFAVICPITSTIKDLPTRYSLPTEMDINGQVIISQLKSFEFNSRNLLLVDHLPLKDMAKINQIIDYIF
ncbi:type II toxin-antitoxin system PemK/MazF family toxin [Carnobacterium maltaromaticum]|uniref:type II toxin-antitoxin system PemK/MazF family toxin n=1 Tax=Carnobacterium maltaromaticum TaxID=2751 RepID=UPI00295E8C15|nr:type II toxin-antitoxin system PemK/MazF family toxin [Carnobacterium maltaromaticum]